MPPTTGLGARLTPVAILLAILTGEISGTVALAATGSLRPTGLLCEYRSAPLGIDTLKPRLSWVLEAAAADDRELRQTAYQIVVSGTREGARAGTGDLWDSGRVASDTMAHVPYAGRGFQSHQACWWAVRVWDQQGQESTWSEPGSWTVGMIEAGDWKGKWIGAPPAAVQSGPAAKPAPLPLFRREFTIEKPIARALAYVCGLGFYELRLNGQKVGDHVLDPGWTNYRKRCLYASYDVSSHLRRGLNACAVMLGNGMYNVRGGRYAKFTGTFGEPKLMLQLHLEFTDGTSQEIATDGQWRTAPGPITFSCIYGGEDYDARLEHSGWDAPGFADQTWQPVRELAGPGGRLVSQSAPPIKVMQILTPVKTTEPAPGVFVYDLGQNFSGWPQLALQGPAGAQVKATPGELLDARGLVSQRSSGGPTWFAYTLKGEGTEVWHPRFSYYGFRYLQIEGAAPASPAKDATKPGILGVEGHFIHSSARRVGRFACSHELLSRVHDLIDAAIRSNLQSVLTDCPHREKLGWLEVSHLLGPAIMFNYDVPLLYRKISEDMSESQLPNGLVPDIAPEYVVFSEGFRDSPEWGSASVINPWHVYARYGDQEILADNYEVMKGYAAYLGTRASGQIVSHGLGDWYDIGPGGPGPSKLTSLGLTATAIYYHDLSILERVAGLLGRASDAARHGALAAEVRQAFNRKFFDSTHDRYDRNSQTANAMPWVLGLVPQDRRASVLSNLVEGVRNLGNHVTAGDVGFRFLLEALTAGGRSDVIYDLAVQPEPPSYLGQIKKGATTLTEAWDADPGSSQNHCMLGHVEEWFYQGLAGLNPDPAGVGFRKFTIRPNVVGDVTWAKASYDSMSGRIESSWELAGERLVLAVSIPPNTSATVCLPAREAAEIQEGSLPLTQARGVRVTGTEPGRVVCAVGSGRYQFSTPWRGRHAGLQ